VRKSVPPKVAPAVIPLELAAPGLPAAPVLPVAPVPVVPVPVPGFAACVALISMVRS
jgi:hypothetical protein